MIISFTFYWTLHKGNQLSANSIYKEREFMFWKALCDTRRQPIQIIIFILSKGKTLNKPDKLFFSLLRCYPGTIMSNFEMEEYESYIFQHPWFRGAFMICYTNLTQTCPTNIQIVFNNRQNLVWSGTVEKQYKRELISEKKNFALLLPPFTNNISSISATRLVEYFEYCKLIGIEKIYLPYFKKEKGLTVYNTKVEDTLKYYTNTGLIENYLVDVPNLGDVKDIYGIYIDYDTFFFSYCLIKNALVFEYFIVQDIDEVVGFDHSKFDNLSQAIQGLRSHFGLNYNQFILPDTTFDQSCLNKTNIDHSTYVITEATYSYKNFRHHMGKTIFNKGNCIVVFFHYCLLKTSDIFDQEDRENEVRQINLTNFEYPILRSFHYRIPYNHMNRPAKHVIRKMCKEENLEELNWLNPISTLLKTNINCSLTRIFSNA